MTILQLVLILLCSSVVAVMAFRFFNLPPILGYLTVGALIASNAHRWIPNEQGLAHLADFGVVFLMFTIGLEFSLAKLKTMRRVVFGLGGGQVVLTTLITAAIIMLLGWPWQYGVIIGLVLTMSSTAIGGKMLAEKMEMDTDHGRAMVGIFLLQDMLVAPILIVLPLLSDMPDDIYFQVGKAILKIVVVFILIFKLGKPMIRWWFRVVANRRSNELFMLNLLLVTLGAAYLTEVLGLSMALGALLVGMLIAETEFRFQIEEDIKPYRDILLGLFFITVGMMLEPEVIVENLPQILMILVGLLFFKALVIIAIGKLSKMDGGTIIRTALGVCSAGEFGFVLLTVTRGQLPAELKQPILAAMVLSMFVAPFLIIYSDKIALRFSRNEWLKQSANLTRLAAQSLTTKNHVILCGYGQFGQIVGRVLATANVPYIAIDSDPELVQQVKASGERIEFGDCVRVELLKAAGLKRATALVIAFDSYGQSLKILNNVKRLRPDMPVIVRSCDDVNLDGLIRAGATEVIPEVFEAGLMLSSHVLAFCGVPIARAMKITRSVRGDRYALLRGFFHGERVIEEPESGEQMLVHAVSVAGGATSIGKTLKEIGLVYPDAMVSAIRRGEVKIKNPSPDTLIQENDTLTIVGYPNQISAAEEKLLLG